MKNWTDHIRTLAKFEDNIGKQVAFETSASMLDDLHKENDELRRRAEAAERERDEMLGMMATYEREFKAVCRQLIRISNNIMAGEYEDNTPEGMIYSEDAWVDCRWQDVTDPLFTSHDEALNKFAIEQQIKGIYEATNYVADNNDISYLPNDFILELCEKYAEQLRQQLNGGE